jgi:hypothetical protein
MFIIYYRYFSLQATSPLGFSDKVRFDVEQNICREEGPLPDCFERPARVVLNVLEKVFLVKHTFFNNLIIILLSLFFRTFLRHFYRLSFISSISQNLSIPFKVAMLY